MAKENTDQSTSVNISSNTLFHFTNSMENLLNILKNDFSPHYCLEVFNDTEIAYPMVSFCDLPLFLIKKHLKFYGSYGIGLSKSWGILNFISPILYVHNNSLLSKVNLDNLSFSANSGKWKLFPKDILAYRQQLYQSFIKPYEGKAYRNGKYKNNVRFYDEREWRHITKDPVFRGKGFVMEKEDYLDMGKRSTANTLLANKDKLNFTPDDIQYIIVKKESEILNIKRKIENLKEKYSWESVQVLTTRIISSERISEDF
jgi:hypothetical protein